MKAFELSEEVNGMANRASGILIMLQDEFIGEVDCRLNDEIIYHVLESAVREVSNIKSLINAFHDQARSELINNQDLKEVA